MCCIARYFMEECTDFTLQNLKFVIVDVVNNVDQLNKDDIDSLLLEKEKFWVGTLITQHHILNGSHWNRKKR